MLRATERQESAAQMKKEAKKNPELYVRLPNSATTWKQADGANRSCLGSWEAFLLQQDTTSVCANRHVPFKFEN